MRPRGKGEVSSIGLRKWAGRNRIPVHSRRFGGHFRADVAQGRLAEAGRASSARAAAATGSPRRASCSRRLRISGRIGTGAMDAVEGATTGTEPDCGATDPLGTVAKPVNPPAVMKAEASVPYPDMRVRRVTARIPRGVPAAPALPPPAGLSWAEARSPNIPSTSAAATILRVSFMGILVPPLARLTPVPSDTGRHFPALSEQNIRLELPRSWGLIAPCSQDTPS